MKLDRENFINLFNKMIISFEDRIFLSKNSIKLFDRKGSDRVLNILSSLFWLIILAIFKQNYVYS